MQKKIKFQRLLTILFFLSGFSGLIYEIIWSRQLLLIFGSTTNSVVAVIAAFMAGLALGSAFLGKISKRVLNPLRLYSFLEITTGIGALSTLVSFSLIGVSYGFIFSNITTNFNLLLAVKFILTFIALLPTTFSMGATLPVIVDYFVKNDQKPISSTAKLYAINTFGAVLGAILSAFVFIELFGLSGSLLLGIFVNFFIGSVAYYISSSKDIRTKNIFVHNSKENADKFVRRIDREATFILITYSLSGFISLSYEVLWTRILTPSTGTYVYSFAAILAFFLLGIALGSLLFEKYFIKIKRLYLLYGFAQIGIGISASLSVFINSFMPPSTMSDKLLISIIPGTFLMGLIFPLVVMMLKNKNASESVGLAYSFNTIGSIFGSLSASLLIIPRVGSAKGILLLSLLNFIIGFLYIYKEEKITIEQKFLITILILLSLYPTITALKRPTLNLLDSSTKRFINLSNPKQNYQIVFLEDEVSSVLGISEIGGKNKELIIDGVGTTSLCPETSLLAHLPILLHKNPKDVLIIAFGMGTTYQSALLHKEVNVDAVELSPSVPKLMYLYHTNASNDLANPRGKVIINDGRNYVKLTKKTYDIIIVDPPPPVNASGTTVLYSRDFYLDAKKILKEDGIFTSWIYGLTNEEDIKMLFRSFYDAFPYVLVLKSPNKLGYYLIGSEKKLVWDKNILKKKFLDSGAINDINDFVEKDIKNISGKLNFDDINKLVIQDDTKILESIKNIRPVTDNRPSTEYFLIRWLINQFQQNNKGDFFSSY
jgi:spermidine synthase